jgi:ribosomal protein L40E
VRTGIDGLDGPQKNNHKPPDKRVLKLGKSKYKEMNWQNVPGKPRKLIAFLSSSSPNTVTSPSHNLVQYSPTRDPRSQCQPPPIPLNTPTPPHRQGPHIIPRSTVDSTSRMEQRTTCRQCKATNPQRANSPRRDPSRPRTRRQARLRRRTTSRAVENGASNR